MFFYTISLIKSSLQKLVQCSICNFFYQFAYDKSSVHLCDQFYNVEKMQKITSVEIKKKPKPHQFSNFMAYRASVLIVQKLETTLAKFSSYGKQTKKR